MSRNEFEADLRDLIDQYSTSLSADDLDEVAGKLEDNADRWRQNGEVWG